MILIPYFLALLSDLQVSVLFKIFLHP